MLRIKVPCGAYNLVGLVRLNLSQCRYCSGKKIEALCIKNCWWEWCISEDGWPYYEPKNIDTDPLASPELGKGQVLNWPVIIVLNMDRFHYIFVWPRQSCIRLKLSPLEIFQVTIGDFHDFACFPFLCSLQPVLLARLSVDDVKKKDTKTLTDKMFSNDKFKLNIILKTEMGQTPDCCMYEVR